LAGTSPRIVYCHCAFAQVLPKDVKQGVLEQLGASAVDVECVPDLCEMSARRDPLLAELVQSPRVRIAACYPRAVRGLFTAAGCSLTNNVEIVNLRVLNADDATRALLSPEPVMETADVETPA
ncbi:MAG TPA: hypothetical protein VFG20_14070, partial [Planctomycetaceae bacterium]|nr:hypothetical protein [Planctomycetaceae bacterium]